MLVSDALTCSMIYAAIAPQAALRSSFGDSLKGPVAEIVVRNWGALVMLVGAMLIGWGGKLFAIRMRDDPSLVVAGPESAKPAAA
jgi:cbb3-type cytochrome oxidase subunit 1